MKRRLVGIDCVLDADEIVGLSVKRTYLGWAFSEHVLEAHLSGSGQSVCLYETMFPSVLTVEVCALLRAECERIAEALTNPANLTILCDFAEVRRLLQAWSERQVQPSESPPPPKRSIWPWRRRQGGG